MKEIMKRFIAIAMMLAGMSMVSNAQTLLYQWAFTNVSDTTTSSIASYAYTPGTGNLSISNVDPNVSIFGAVGADAINPVIYFTNANTGPGSGPGVDAAGALVANGQAYGTGGVGSGVAMAQNLNLGNRYQITMTFWFKLNPGFSGSLSRFFNIGATNDYDNGGKGSGKHNGL